MADHNELNLEFTDQLGHLKFSKPALTHEEYLRYQQASLSRYYQTPEGKPRLLIHYRVYLLHSTIFLGIVFQRRIGSGVALVSLIAENILSHPFQVLRRQCQVC